MNRYKNVIIAIILLSALSGTIPFILGNSVEIPKVSAQIIEINNFSQLLNYIKPNSLVLIDLDDTLLEAKQTMGTDRWFIWRAEFYKRRGVESKLAFEKALMDWVAVQCLTEVKLTEPGTDKIVKQIQDEGFTAMGLTTRGASLATRTIQQLGTINIDLSLSAPETEEIVFLNPHEVIYKNGILFTSGTHKGKALFKFLNLISEKLPLKNIEEIVFINDKKTHLAEIMESCGEKNIPFVGLRYGFADERIRNFSEEIAEYQFKQFGKIISDEDALNDLKK